jgi:outer membrane protein TolC
MNARTIAVAVAVLVAAGAISGCASVDMQDTLAQTNAQHGAFTQGQLALAQTAAQRAEHAAVAQRLLSQPLDQAAAVQLALVNSPQLQALLAQHWADAAGAAQSGRIANPKFTFERSTSPDEVDIGRSLGFGLLELLTLPARHANAKRMVERVRLQLGGDVVDTVTAVRQAWVRAVAAQQTLGYAKQVQAAAQASAELARRMQVAGNFNRLDRARQQLFYADASSQLAAAQNHAAVQREALVRLLGLTDAQSARLQLPQRLPDLPAQARSPQDVARAALAGRLDVQLAQAALDQAAAAQGLGRVSSFTDIEIGVRRDTRFDNAHGSATPVQGYEISLTLPVFDWGGVRRDAMQAQTLAAANHLEATVRQAASSLRESYGSYRTALDVATHYRDEVVPLRRTISDERLLRYNGMLLGVFDLLADAREQIASVVASIAAQQQFWLADAALQAALVGRPSAVAAVGSVAPMGDSAAPAH